MEKLVDRIAAKFGFSRMVEAANWRPEERSWVWAQASDAKLDISSGDRTRLLALSRKLFYNNAIVKGASRDKATFSVGGGIGIRPQATTGTSWDDEAEAYWAEWSKEPEISGRYDMRALQMLVSEAVDRDGEIFAILTKSNDGRPSVQLVESHRCSSPADAASKQVVDGVKMDKFGRPIAYSIVDGDGESKTTKFLPAENVLHVYEPARADQARGYPSVAVALNSLLDRDELLRFEMQAAKIGSSIGLVIQNATGSVGGSGAAGFLGDIGAQSGAETLTRETVFGGGMIPRLKSTEKVESFMMNRPNEKLDAHLEQYIRAAAIGLDLPFEWIWDTAALGGVAQRFIIAKAARTFAARQDLLINAFLSKLWRYAIASAIQRRELPRVEGWQRVEWQTPRSITVDVGRESLARREDVLNGLMPLSDYFGEQGVNWRDAVKQMRLEREFLAQEGLSIGKQPAAPAEDPAAAAPAPAPAEMSAKPKRTRKRKVV